MKRAGPDRRAARPFLSLQSAAFRLGDRLVFEGTSWRFNSDEHWAIIGGNGSGKTLFGDAVRNRLPLVRGELRHHFRGPEKSTPEDAIGHIAFEERKTSVHGMVVQSRWHSAETEGATTVRDVLGYDAVMEVNPFELKHPTAERVRFDRRSQRAIRWFSLQRLLERPVISLSNGETQRVQLARALCRPLRLLILDEPFTGLDAAGRDNLQSLLERLMRTRLRILLITNRPEDLPPGITHVLWVEDCRVIASGPRKRLLGESQTRQGLGARGAATPSPQRDPRPSGHGGELKGLPLVSLRKVSVRYGATAILRDIDWEIQEGESWALLGPNGSGKSTLLSLISGDNPQAYANEVVVFGKQRGVAESISELKRQIGWVSPELQVYFEDSATCLETVESGFTDSIGLFEPVTVAQRRQARSWLRRFGLLGLADSPLYTLSAGIQRVALLARALVKRPRLLLLDEPCQGLDASHRERFLSLLDRLIRVGSETAIYVTHRPDEIPPSIKRILRLKQGVQLP